MTITEKIKMRMRSTYHYLRNLYRLLRSVSYDLFRYLRFSPLGGPPRCERHYDAYVTMDYHRLEKGLALRDSRPGFGKKPIRDLIYALSRYQNRYAAKRTSQIAVNSLSSYQNLQEDEYKSPAIAAFLDQWHHTTLARSTDEGGVKDVTKSDIHLHAKRDLKNFFTSRYSVRDFSDEPVAVELIREAIGMAQKTPSVCNRQAFRAHVLIEPTHIQKALSFQNGNRGFNHQVDKLIIVTTDLRAFVSAGERNQCWIDGGMFSMSLVYALHSLGLGTCCLNWSVNWYTDQSLRSVVNIESHEAIIMMIAVGHLPETFRVTHSPRHSLDTVMTLHQSETELS